MDLESYISSAQNRDQFEQMCKMFEFAETPDELRAASMLFILDMDYARSDISLALKAVSRSKGWPDGAV